MKMNFIVFTLSISIRKREETHEEIEHKQRIKEVNERNLDRRSQFLV